MKRLTTETPKDNLEAALNLFYIKDHETWVRGGGHEPDFEDVNLSDFIRDVAKKHFPDIEMPESNDDLIFAMAEWLMDGVDEPTGVLALLYTAAWTYSELRRKLMQYEDTGLTPEEIRNALDVNDIIPEINVTVDHILDLLKAEQDERLVVLPCKAGDHVWMDGREAIVEEFFGYETERYLHAQFYDNMQYIDIPFDEFGKTVFLTHEDAETALKGEHDG